jgi:hypothetical protein
MVTERDETDTEWPGEVGDPVREAIGQLLVAIIEATAEGSPERARAMNVDTAASRAAVPRRG